MKILPVILSGGSGTRLWPVSRADFPKQLQNLCGLGSLLQQTAARLPQDAQTLLPIVVCGDSQRFLVAEQLREAGLTASQIVLEPVARSTAPALAVAALLATDPSDTVLVAMPADHYIGDTAAFAVAIQRAAALAMGGRLMTLGIKPTAPHTGFGYIQKGVALVEDTEAFAVTRFKEKPDAETASAYVQSGDYFWNAGIFIFRADQYLSELGKLQPAILEASKNAVAQGKVDLDFLRLDKESLAQSPSLSVDYAVMEHAALVGVLPVSFGWSDIGGWSALWQIGAKDKDGNVLLGDVLLKDVKDSYVRSESRLVTAIGLEKMVVIDTPDALFIAPMDRADEGKDIVAEIKKAHRKESEEHRRVWRPWGFYEGLDHGKRFQVKQIMVKPGAKLSLQMHHHRAEHWVVVSGTAKVVCGEQISLFGPDETVYIPLGTKHRLENPGKTPLYVIEVQSGDYLGEDDIVRFDDDYNR